LLLKFLDKRALDTPALSEQWVEKYRYLFEKAAVSVVSEKRMFANNLGLWCTNWRLTGGQPVSRLFAMIRHLIVFLSTILLTCGLSAKCYGQNTVTGTCVAFSADGALATGTVKTDDLETKLDQLGAAVVTTHAAIGRSRSGGLRQGCEEAFSVDGRWLATVVPGSELTVVILDRKTARLHVQFSSEWFRFRDLPVEPGYRSSVLGGFLQDDSVVLWRYVPRAVPDTSDASNVDLHLQQWSVEGEMLSDQNLGRVGSGPGGRHPIAFNGLSLLWIPSECDVFCYRRLRISASQIAEENILKLPSENASEPVALPGNEGLLTVLDRRGQKAAILDSSGRLNTKVNLPFFPNLLGPLVPDWFQALKPAISYDGKFAAIARTRVAWVLVDTDRDWGSEIVLLRMHPLAIAKELKIGKGGIGAVAVDHRNGVVRLVGFWKGRWHDVQCGEGHLGKCR
jgi:hypothetical protein